MTGRNELQPRPTVLGESLDPTRAKPEPWFVGSGRGLMIAVLSLCAILLVARAASTIWLAEEAWEWWKHRPISRPATGLPPAVTQMPALPPSYDPADWITSDDYPPAAIRADQQGMVSIRWSVGSNGRVNNCAVVKSSGHALLDRAACRAIVRRGRYHPVPADAAPRVYSRHVVWNLPDE